MMRSDLVFSEANSWRISVCRASNRLSICASIASISSYTRSPKDGAQAANDSFSSRWVTWVSSSQLTRVSSRLRVRPKSWSSGSLAWVITLISYLSVETSEFALGGFVLSGFYAASTVRMRS